MTKLTLQNTTIAKLQKDLADKRASKNFASRKTHTKQYAVKHNLYLPSGEKSWNDDNLDWTQAILQKYDTDFETWSDIHWKSKTTNVVNLNSMTDDELKTYKKIASRKSRFKSQLECCDVKLDKFLVHIGVNELEFFSDEYQAANIVTKGNPKSIYNLEYYIDNGQLEPLLR